MPGPSARRLSAALLATLALALPACSLQQFTADSTADLLLPGSVALERESDVQFARDALPGSLKTIETFLVSTPRNEKLLLLLARGYTSYAFAFLEGDMERALYHGTQDQINEASRRALLHYLRAREYGFMLLAKPALEDAARTLDKTLRRELESATVEDVPGIFWVAFPWASAINLAQNDPDMVGALPLVALMIERVLELDPGYFYSGGHLLLGVYNSSRPVMFGGNPEEARKHFEAAMKADGERNLLIPFMFGRMLGAQTQDRDLFNAMMKRVLDADPTQHPDLRLNNEIARARARFWLEHASEIFVE